MTGKGGNDGYDPSTERPDGASVIRVHRCNRARDGVTHRNEYSRPAAQLFTRGPSAGRHEKEGTRGASLSRPLFVHGTAVYGTAVYGTAGRS